jgi:glycine cleavage system H protein
MSIAIDPTCRYTESHEWVRVEGGYAVAGITDYAQQQLSDIVYVELPEVGDRFAKGDVFCTVESVKAASECYTPLSGEVVEINEELADTPEAVNKEPYGQGWFVRFRLADPAQVTRLMDAQAYAAYAAHAAEQAEQGSH